MKHEQGGMILASIILILLVGLTAYSQPRRTRRGPAPTSLPCKQVQVNANQAVQVCGNNATVTIITPKRNPTDPFVIYLLCEKSGALSIQSYSFQLKDITSTDNSPTMPNVLSFLKQLQDCSLSNDVTVFRLIDETAVEPSARPSTLASEGNLGVLVVPKSVLAGFVNAHVAFAYLKSITDQLNAGGTPIRLPCRD